MDRKDLLFTVNPVFATAKGCLGLLMHTCVKEAEELGKVIDTTVKTSPDAPQTPPEIRRSYMVSNEARYHIGNIMAERSGCDVIVDLPCGYVPRGLAISGAGKQFYGLDLPAVIEELEPAIRGIATKEQNELMHFHSVDATNLDSLKSALDGAHGKLCILMDGLLGYFNDPELEAVCNNIREILKEHGGMWITADKYARELGAETFTALTDSNGEIVKQMMEKGGTRVADIPVNHTVIQGTVPEAEQYFRDHGFEIKEMSYGEIVPDLLSMKDDPEGMEKLREAYQNIKLWVMTVRSDAKDNAGKSKEFQVWFEPEGDTLRCRIAGRLDTITAPELLTGFQDNHSETLKEIYVDLIDTEYISSAGLRVLLIMCKSLPDAAGFHVLNPSEGVMDILEVTGFADMLGMH